MRQRTCSVSGVCIAQWQQLNERNGVFPFVVVFRLMYTPFLCDITFTQKKKKKKMASSEEYIPSKHQVAGHRFEEGRVGSLVDGKGLFFKPLQGDERGEREVAFYERFWQDESVPSSIKSFFPKFYGVKELPAVGPVDKLKHAALEDMTHSYVHPSIVDIKMGRRTWYPGCRKEYEEKMRSLLQSQRRENPVSRAWFQDLRHAGDCSLQVLGLKLQEVSQVYDPKTGDTWRAEREWGKALDAQGTIDALKRFIAPGDVEQLSREAEGRIRSLLSQLKELQQWFESQGTYHFYSASLLLMYDIVDPSTITPKKSETQESTAAESPSSGFHPSDQLEVRLIDFAHVVEGKGKPDDNFLFGLQTLSRVFDQVLTSMGSL